MGVCVGVCLWCVCGCVCVWGGDEIVVYVYRLFCVFTILAVCIGLTVKEANHALLCLPMPYITDIIDKLPVIRTGGLDVDVQSPQDDIEVIMQSKCLHTIFALNIRTPLRKHHYSNILKIHHQKLKVSDKNSDIFSYFCSKHRL